MNLDERVRARQRLELEMNDRRGFHVEDLDEETRIDLLDALIDAVINVGKRANR